MLAEALVKPFDRRILQRLDLCRRHRLHDDVADCDQGRVTSREFLVTVVETFDGEHVVVPAIHALEIVDDLREVKELADLEHRRSSPSCQRIRPPTSWPIHSAKSISLCSVSPTSSSSVPRPMPTKCGRHDQQHDEPRVAVGGSCIAAVLDEPDPQTVEHLIEQRARLRTHARLTVAVGDEVLPADQLRVATAGERLEQVDEKVAAVLFLNVLAREQRGHFVEQIGCHPLDQRSAHIVAAAEVMQQRRVAHTDLGRDIHDRESIETVLAQTPLGDVEHRQAGGFRASAHPFGRDLRHLRSSLLT